ncbi:MAG: hypothetical protein H6643_07225 [Caldilineaceae bacterium]|nr:hypothetical protein [Caldilineaceae bacterium]
MRQLFHRRSAIIGMIILGSLILIAIFAPLLATHDPTKSLIGIEDVQKRAAPCIHLLGMPNQPQHFFGLDGNVRPLQPYSLRIAALADGWYHLGRVPQS